MIRLSRRSIDQTLFIYGLCLSVLLSLGALLNLPNKVDFLTMLLFLPVTLYFVAAFFLRSFNLSNSLLNHQVPEHHRYFGEFNLITFFEQVDPVFLLSLILFALAFAISLIRLSLQILS